MKIIIVGDLHLTAAAADSYRFGIFDWLQQKIIKHRPEAIVFLGDLTDRKDEHGAWLVNRIIENMVQLCRKVPSLLIVKGNHDYVDPTRPYFGFLNHMGMNFVIEPHIHWWFEPDERGKRSTLFLPHVQSPKQWGADVLGDLPTYGDIFMHQTFDGARAENGKKMVGGFDRELIRPLSRVWSGDVHVPQTLGALCYVGAPYHIKFGDDYEPRVILCKNGVTKNLRFPAPRKLLIEAEPDDFAVKIRAAVESGDQVKLRISLDREMAASRKSVQRLRDLAHKTADRYEASLVKLEFLAAGRMIDGDEAQAAESRSEDAVEAPSGLKRLRLVRRYVHRQGLSERSRRVGRDIVRHADQEG